MLTQGRSTARGFTLIEAMVVVAVIGIITAIAWPIYQAQSMKQRRTEAIGALMRISNELSAYHSDHIDDGLGYSGYSVSAGISGGLRYYSVNAPVLAASTYTVTLTPIGVQATDTECANFTLTETGKKGNTGTASSAATCWSSN